VQSNRAALGFAAHRTQERPPASLASGRSLQDFKKSGQLARHRLVIRWRLYP